MIVEQEVMGKEFTFLLEGRSTKVFLAQTRMCAFFFRKVSHTIFAKLSFPK
jgi:hypothetical protein